MWTYYFPHSQTHCHILSNIIMLAVTHVTMSHLQSQYCHQQLRTHGDLSIQANFSIGCIALLPQIIFCVYCTSSTPLYHVQTLPFYFSAHHSSSTIACSIPFVLCKYFLFLAHFAPAPFLFIHCAYCASFLIILSTFITPLYLAFKITSIA